MIFTKPRRACFLGIKPSQKRFQLSHPANDMKLKVENRSNTALTASLTHSSGESVSNPYFAAHVEPGVPWEWSPDQSGQKDGLPKGDYILQIRASGNPVHAEVWGSLSLAKS
ncbi:hypothetical protein B9G55_14370 [Saccharibacillus sp. O16]|nr:hypothetical protein B9G55_14370 [Saccharibacillus sp. O16]